MAASRARRILTGIALVTAAALGLSACTPPAPSAELPESITLSLHQTRQDLVIRQLEIAVTNGTDAVLTITRLVFDSPQFVEPVAWAKDSTTIGPGLIADLPVLLPEANCDTEDPRPTVEFDYELSDGRSGTAIAVPGDEFDRMPQLATDDCLAQAIADYATIEAVTPPRIGTLNGKTIAQYDLTITPTGLPGTITIDEALSAILIAVADPITGAVPDSQPIGLVVDGTAEPSVLTLTIMANRCDDHAIADDKRGTFLGLRVTTADGTAGAIFIAPADDVKAALYDFVRQACG